MKRNDRWRLAASIAPPVLLLSVAAVVACSENTPSRETTPATTLAPQRDVMPATVRARDDLHKRNRMDWIGVAHNRALDAFRADLRKPGLLTRRLCSYLADFAAAPQHAPPEKATLGAGVNRIAMRNQLERQLCNEIQTASRSDGETILTSLGGSFVASPPEGSTQTNELLSQVQTAIDGAADSYDLSSRLSPILSASAALDAEGQTVVATTVSVAQSSFEYWEQELPRLQSELEGEYGSCLQANMQSGYTAEESRQICLNGGSQAVLFRRSAPGGGTVRVSADASAPICYPGAAWNGVKRTAKADALGAVAGFWATLGVTRELGSAALGALATAIAKSGYEATMVTAELIQCAY